MCITALYLHAATMREYLDIVGKMGLRGQPQPTTPLQQAYPAFAADAQTWVRHALSLVEGAQGPQLRFTDIDNAPYGREVHWNSAWAWLIGWSGWLDHWLTGEPLPRAVERITIWLPPTTLAIFIVGISGWVARRVGALGGVAVAIAMAGHPRVYEGFFPSYADHHGLLTIAVLGVVLGGALMGVGWWKPTPPGESGILPASPDMARRAARISAAFGAFGLWISAASVIPGIAIVGFTGLLAVLVVGQREEKQGARFDAQVWRLWGRTGAGLGIAFYLLEYFPSHLGLRLESNHPLYALAWWAGGELIAELCEWRLSSPSRRLSPVRVGLSVLGIGAAPAVILLGGPTLFVVADPFLARLHRDYIQEFLPLWRSITGTGWKTFFSVVGAENIPLLVACGCLIAKRGRVPAVLWFCVTAGTLFTAMGWVQSRWLLNVSGVQVVLTVVLLAWLLAGLRSTTRWAVALGAALLIYAPHAITRVTWGKEDVKARRVSPKDAQSMLWRDIAAVLRNSQTSGQITVLTSPNSSTGIGYYGRFKTLGTLYWENLQGLRSAATILSARTQDEAAELIRRHGVTHLAMVSEEHFIDSYFRLLNPGATDAEIRQCFGWRLLVDRVVPPWLQMLPYKVPDDLSGLNIGVMLFKVAFDQTPADALYHIAGAKVALGNVAQAEADYRTLVQQSPQSYQPWLRLGELLFAREEWAQAAEALISGIERAPANERLALYANTASGFYRKGRRAEAAAVYRNALKESFVPELAAYLAFILATSADDALRNGGEALKLSQRAVDSNQTSPTFLNSLAAALAELGRYSEAVEVASRAAANAKIQGDLAAQRVTEQRLLNYRQGKPWRD
jgi:tetratricopeptide (TPR) repeat protein